MLHMPVLIFSLATCTLFQLCALVFTDLHTPKKKKITHTDTHRHTETERKILQKLCYPNRLKKNTNS